ncbi:START domain-containing protein [Pyxidicoccus fallax]|uniref:START domain-containing protein n=1 Tax=Pyxidicoccus fallax TaxID=394095 RepID=A0A848LWF7_9BACT|nr:START domain-containing protein [Pyxidicoccus fallax]NMO21892.1 START domain-containing protein [Pyxidicoccus fallax]NPC84888.1 START domain-containing protein [Pyxidicoccus fallax]
MRLLSSRTAAVAAVLVLVLVAGAAGAEEKWETVAEKPYLVKVRPRPGSNARDVWAEGDIAASATDVQAVLSDVDTYRLWMPYVKESRTLKELPDGARLTYTRLDLPVVSSRDYVSRVVTESKLAEDGTGVFAQRWTAEPDAIPERRGTVRLRLNEGSWHVEPRGEGKSRAVYRFSVDPAGSIPGFLANMGQKDGVADTFRAVEKRARAHEEARRKAK